MAEQEDVEFSYPYKHINNTPTWGAILTENQMETGRTPLFQPNLQERPP